MCAQFTHWMCQLPHSNTGGQFGDQRPDGYEGVVKCLGSVVRKLLHLGPKKRRSKAVNYFCLMLSPSKAFFSPWLDWNLSDLSVSYMVLPKFSPCFGGCCPSTPPKNSKPQSEANKAPILQNISKLTTAQLLHLHPCHLEVFEEGRLVVGVLFHILLKVQIWRKMSKPDQDLDEHQNS